MTIHYSSYLGVANQKSELHPAALLTLDTYGVSLIVGLTLFSAVTALLHLSARRRWRKREDSLLAQVRKLRLVAEFSPEYTRHAPSIDFNRLVFTKELLHSLELEPENSEPPAMAERLLRFVTKSRYQESLIGDRAERFKREVEKFGLKRAQRLYWADTWRSLWPLLCSNLKRWDVISAVIGSFHYFFGR